MEVMRIRDNDYVFVPAQHNGRFVGYGDSDPAQIRQLAMWIRTISFAVGAHRPMSPFTHALSRTDTSKDKNSIESCCIVSRKKELQEEQFGFRVYPSTVQWVQGLKP